MEWRVTSSFATAAMTSEPDLLIERAGGVGLITLNRPKALNALTFDQTRTLAALLAEWAGDDGIDAVLLRGAGERAFCAGGDIREIYNALVAGDPWPVEFWREEYALNLQIADYRKPIVAVMHGIVMGGGIGISAHAAHRVVTETSSIAMPETSIGFLPDVGASYLLSRAPGETGTHLALTAGRVAAADAMTVGLADVHLATERVAELPEALRGCRTARDARARLQELASPARPGQLPEARPWIDEAYRADSVEEICARLESRPEPPAREALAMIRANSPTALKLALSALRRGRKLPDLAACLAMEHTIVSHLTRRGDFREGIRAAVIDKDRKPKWSPARLEEVSEAAVEDYFRPWA